MEELTWHNMNIEVEDGFHSMNTDCYYLDTATDSSYSFFLCKEDMADVSAFCIKMKHNLSMGLSEGV